MAFSSGFFNSKGLDRTYTAEDFCDYLGSIICNGIQAQYGDCFKLASNGLAVTVGSGKAWINGHYFISNDSYSIDLTHYRDSINPRYVSIGIVLDTAEAVRDVKIEVIPGVPAENPTVPDILAGGMRTCLHLYAVRIDPDNSAVGKIIDYRNDDSKCGYCKCILGKCGVTELQKQLTDALTDLEEYKHKLDEVEAKVEDIGDIVDAGKCGDHAFYTRYSTGKLVITGTGDMYDYDWPNGDTSNLSPFSDNQDIKKAVVSSGITRIGDYAFRYSNEIETVSLPSTLTSIGAFSFYPEQDMKAVKTTARGLTELHIPPSVITIDKCAFCGTRLTELTVPTTVQALGNRVFASCIFLKTVRFEAAVIPEFAFVECYALNDVTLARTVTEIKSHCFNYCKALTELKYEGTLADWAAVEKKNNWDGNHSQADGYLRKIICKDGCMQFDPATKEWTEVHE